MVIDPSTAGVLCTIFVEMALIIVIPFILSLFRRK